MQEALTEERDGKLKYQLYSECLIGFDWNWRGLFRRLECRLFCTLGL